MRNFVFLFVFFLFFGFVCLIQAATLKTFVESNPELDFELKVFESDQAEHTSRDLQENEIYYESIEETEAPTVATTVAEPTQLPTTAVPTTTSPSIDVEDATTIEFDSTMGMTVGNGCDSIGALENEALEITIMEVLELDGSDSVKITECAESAVTTGTIRRKLQASKNIDVTAKITLLVTDASDDEATTIYDNTAAKLTMSVNSGEFQSTLDANSIQLGANGTVGVTVSSVTNGPVVVILPVFGEDGSSSGGIGVGAIVGIVIASLACPFFAFCFYYFVFVRDANKGYYESADIEMKDKTNTASFDYDLVYSPKAPISKI